jgi:hypothetical protein
MRKLTAWKLAGTVGLFCLVTAAQQPTTFHGEISDSQCALNVHSLTKSHEEMLKSKSGAAGTTPATCSVYCVSYLGGQFVLTAKSGHVFHLDNQDMPRKFVGQKVTLHGSLDSKGDLIHVLDIEGQ